MSIILAPYNDSMRLGQGFNSYTHTICIDKAVIVNEASPTNATKTPSQVVSFSSRFVEKLSEVLNTMNISYSSSIKRGTVEVSGNTESVDEDKFKSSDLNAIVSVKVVNQTTTIEDDAIFQPMKGVMPGSPRFNEVYGDSYISGFIEGGNFTGILSMKILDRSKVDKVSKAIKSGLNSHTAGDFTLDSMRSSTSSTSAAFRDTETTISVSWMGGGQVKETTQAWDLDTMFAAAASFSDKVAECPQRTWAILTKYKANRSFVEWSNSVQFSPLEYDNVASYTAELFDNYMEYKSLLKTLQDIISNKDDYQIQKDKHNAIGTDIATLIAVRAALRDEMDKIVLAVDLLSKDPGSLKRQAIDSKKPMNGLVSRIIEEATGGYVAKKSHSVITTTAPPAISPITTNPNAIASTTNPTTNALSAGAASSNATAPATVAATTSSATLTDPNASAPTDPNASASGAATATTALPNDPNIAPAVSSTDPNVAPASTPPVSPTAPNTTAAAASAPPISPTAPNTTAASAPPVSPTAPNVAAASTPPVSPTAPNTTGASAPPVSPTDPNTTVASAPPATTTDPNTAAVSAPPASPTNPNTAAASAPPVSPTVPNVAAASAPPASITDPNAAVASTSSPTVKDPNTSTSVLAAPPVANTPVVANTSPPTVGSANVAVDPAPPGTTGIIQSGAAAVVSNFDFNSMIAPEIWSDLFPISKNSIAGAGGITGVTDKQIRGILGFPQPPTTEPAPKPALAPTPIIIPAPPAPIAPAPIIPAPKAPAPVPIVIPRPQPRPFFRPILPQFNPIPHQDPEATKPETPAENTTICAWVFNNSARLIYQDSQGNLREAQSVPQWHTTAIPMTNKAKKGSPITLVTWADQARLYYVSEDGQLREKCWQNSTGWSKTEGGQFAALKLHPDSKLASSVEASKTMINVYCQGIGGYIRKWECKGGWSLSNSSLSAAFPGTAMVACAVSPHIRVIFRLPNGKIAQVESNNDGSTFSPVIGPAFEIAPYKDSPLAGGAWQSEPRDRPKEPIDQMRYFFRVDPNTLGLYTLDVRKPVAKNFEVFPFQESTGQLAYCVWHEGKQVQQRLFAQNKQKQIVELSSPTDVHNWTVTEVLPTT